MLVLTYDCWHTPIKMEKSDVLTAVTPCVLVDWYKTFGNHADYVLCPEDGGSRFIRGVVDALSASHPRSQQSSKWRNFERNVKGDSPPMLLQTFTVPYTFNFILLHSHIHMWCEQNPHLASVQSTF